MRLRSKFARASAFIGLPAFVFWVSSVLLEFFIREPMSWILGSVCAVLSTYPVRCLFRRFSISDASTGRMFARYILGSVVGYIVMAVTVFLVLHIVLLVRGLHPAYEGDLLAALAAIWSPLWGLPFGGAMGMLRLSRRATPPTP